MEGIAMSIALILFFFFVLSYLVMEHFYEIRYELHLIGNRIRRTLNLKRV